MWRKLGRIIDVVDIEFRGPAILTDLKLADFPTDLVIRIGDLVRIDRKEPPFIETNVCGVEIRPLLTILLPVGTDVQGLVGAGVSVATGPTLEHESENTL